MGKHSGLDLLVLALHSAGDFDVLDPTRNGGAMGEGLTGDGESSTVEGTVLPQLRVLLGTPSSGSAASCLGAGPSLSLPVRLLLLVGSQKPVR